VTDEQPPRPSARDLVRRRSTRYRAPDTGRMHHIGAAPEAVPVHTDDGVGVARTTAWQLADRTVVQLRAQRETTAARMEQAAAALDFEAAAALRDELAALDAELAARG
jgi:excinuclease UvrABC helicase subunit UvrB